MTNRTYKIQDHIQGTTKTYKGFNRNYSGPELNHVILILIDGEVDVYAISNPKKTTDLIEFLSNEIAGSVEILGIYTRS